MNVQHNSDEVLDSQQLNDIRKNVKELLGFLSNLDYEDRRKLYHRSLTPEQ